jgi:hypothetical protein
MAEETVTVNSDGSTTFDGETGYDGGGGEESTMPPVMDDAQGEPMMEDVVKGIDPAIYLLLAVVLLAALYFVYARKSRSDDGDDFFSNLDGEKVSVLTLRTWEQREERHAMDWAAIMWGSVLRLSC